MINFALRPLYPRRNITRTHGTGGWLGCRAGLDVLEKTKSVASDGNAALDLPACSINRYSDGRNLKSIYTSSYDGHFGSSLSEVHVADLHEDGLAELCAERSGQTWCLPLLGIKSRRGLAHIAMSQERAFGRGLVKGSCVVFTVAFVSAFLEL